MLAMADLDGFVASSIPGLAARARVTVEQAEAALQVFLSPDKYSRTPDHEGRRIKVVKGGWLLLNHEAYRKAIDAEAEKERKRDWAREQRSKVKGDVVPFGLHPATNSESSEVASPSLSDSSGSDPERATVVPRPGAIVAPDSLQLNAQQLVRCQELRLDPAEILRDFKLQEFNRAYTDWPRRLSKWIEDEKIKRETARFGSKVPVDTKPNRHDGGLL
jgi:hypothetical protein